MPDAAASARRPARPRLTKGLVASLVRRGYALVLIAVIVWLTFLAIRYLVRTLVYSPPPPPQVVQLPTRLTADVLRTGRQAWAGIEAAQHPRTPLSHYHRIDSWIEPDRFNDCTRSGCHGPLPHTKRKEVRAFLNMHATSIHCGVCHMRCDTTPLPLTWYDLQTGQQRQSPALFQVSGLMTLPNAELITPARQTHLAGLLREATSESGGDPRLVQLAKEIHDVRAGSAALQAAIDAVREALPQQFRGEYGAKLALRDPQLARPVLGQPDAAAAVSEYLAHGAALDEAGRADLLARVHPLKRPEPLRCSACHRATGSLIDFAALGYPEFRREALFRPVIFQMIEHIAAGQPMHLPQFMTPGAAPSQPATQPSSAP